MPVRWNVWTALACCSLGLLLAGCGAHRASAPVGGPVTAGFDPVSFSSISADRYWLLGSAPCEKRICTAIVRTTDGGRRFARIPAPRAPLHTGDGSSNSIDTLRFATPLDGFAYDAQSMRSAEAASNPIWETRDGGAHWRRLGLRHVLAFTTSGGHVLAVTASCHNGDCARLEVRRRALGGVGWSSQRLPVGHVESLVAMTAEGSSLWLSLSPTAGRHPDQLLLTSTDAGRTFIRRNSPCFTGLGGVLVASSSSVIWAVCPSGMLAGAFRSADGGATWSPLHTGRELANSAQIAPASDSTAILETGDQTELLRTTDAGATFATVYPVRSGFWTFIGFTDARTADGLRVIEIANRSLGRLIRSNDGGVHWSAPIRFATP